MHKLTDIRVKKDISYSNIFAAFKLLSTATFLTIVLGIATNKIIAMIGGLNGIAMIGLFRNLINVVLSILSMGIATVVLQRISTTSNIEMIDEYIKSALLFLSLQICIVASLSLFSADIIAHWIFSDGKASSHLLEIRIVLLMAIGSLVMQTMIALLNGKVNLKPITIINVVSSLSTFALVYPLIKMGNIGLAFVVGSGSFIGSCFGIFYVWRIYGLSIRKFTASINMSVFFSKLPISIYLIIHPIVITITFLSIQAIVNNSYGVNGLGFYNAVTTIESTTIMLIMSSVRSYYLPVLGQLDNQSEKEEFVNKMITMLLIFLLPISVCLILGAKYILVILYNKEFIPAANLVALQSMALLLAAYSWCYAFYLNHKAHYGTYLILDTVWASLLLGGTWYVASHNFPLIAVVINYLMGSLISFSLYLFVIRKRYGRGMLNMRNIKLGLSSFLLLVLSIILSQKSGILLQAIYFIFIGSYTYYLVKKYYFQESSLEVQ